MNNSQESIKKMIGQTQDGHKISNDVWGNFLSELIEDNTDSIGYVDADNLEMDLKYSISEFTKAIKSISSIAEKIRTMKNYTPDPNTKWIDGTDLINELAKF